MFFLIASMAYKIFLTLYSKPLYSLINPFQVEYTCYYSSDFTSDYCIEFTRVEKDIPGILKMFCSADWKKWNGHSPKVNLYQIILIAIIQ
jgi:hypothetical protein